MEIKEIQNKSEWENFLLECKDKTFLQSWSWGNFQQSMGNRIWRLGVYDQEELISLCLITLIGARRGKYLLVQHGPTLIQDTKIKGRSLAKLNKARDEGKALSEHQNDNVKFKILETFLFQIKEIAKKEKCSFVRIAPLLEKNKENEEIFYSLGFTNSPMHASAYEATWKLDITSSEEELLRGMRKTTRYLIKQAQKNIDIKISQRWDMQDIDVFYKIHQEVVKIQKFTPFSLEYLKNEFSSFLSDKQASIFFGEYKGEVIAAAFVIFWSNIGFYHHAALLPEYHKIPIAYLLQWEAIREAKKRNCLLYDFWGYVNPKENPGHPWAGPTLFKMGFGGKSYQYLKTLDLPLSKKYWLINFFEKIRKTKRGL